ncbi:unnamed protein product [Phaeothamnion confervicola]
MLAAPVLPPYHHQFHFAPMAAQQSDFGVAAAAYPMQTMYPVAPIATPHGFSNGNGRAVPLPPAAMPVAASGGDGSINGCSGGGGGRSGGGGCSGGVGGVGSGGGSGGVVARRSLEPLHVVPGSGHGSAGRQTTRATNSSPNAATRAKTEAAAAATAAGGSAAPAPAPLRARGHRTRQAARADGKGA